MSRRKKIPTEQEVIPETEWTTLDAIKWLSFHARKQKFGTNCYQHVIDVLRRLVIEKKQFIKEIETHEAEIARLQKLKTPIPYDVGGQGQWS